MSETLVQSARVPFTVDMASVPGEPALFVDHQRNGRSGHVGHALVKYAPDCLLAFYADTSGDCPPQFPGHSCFGWMAYRRSTDGGRNWSAPRELDYSKKVFLEGIHTISCEKAVSPASNVIILFCLVNDRCAPFCCSPWGVPTYLVSRDGGETWSESRNLGDQRGRIYDARIIQDEILVLQSCNPNFEGRDPLNHYALYGSRDGGGTFELKSILPFDIRGRGYGALAELPYGRLIVYVYNLYQERYPDTLISDDGGHTWGAPDRAFLAKSIRNPQIARVGGSYILHGRSGQLGPCYALVLYTSDDGIHWDEGTYLRMPVGGGFGYACFYSNNVVLDDHRVLIQFSDAYAGARVNIRHLTLSVPRA